MKRRLIIPALFLGLAAAGFVVLIVTNRMDDRVGTLETFRELSPSPAPPFADPYFAQMADRLGMTGESRDLFQRTQPRFVEHLELGDALVGEYRRGEIHITQRFRGRTDSEAVKYIAHEYLHAAWYQALQGRPFIDKRTSDQKNGLKEDIDTVYRQHQAHFDEALRVYNGYFSDPSRAVTQGSERWYSEMHSILGTEVARSLLPPRLEAWYARWLPNRAATPEEFRG